MSNHYAKKWDVLITIVFALLAGGIAAMFFCNGFSDLDFVWSAKVGEKIIKTGKITGTFNFSWLYQATTLNEICHSWIYNEIIGSLYMAFKSHYEMETAFNIAGVIYCIITSILLFLSIRLTVYKESISTPWLVFISIMSGFLCSNPRAKNLGYSLFFIALYILTLSDKNRTKFNIKPIIYLPFISILWANIHGGSIPMLFCFELFYTGIAILSDYNKKHDKNILNIRLLESSVTYLIITVLSIITGLINPYGYKLYTYFFKANDELTKKYISEWQPGNLMDIDSLIPLILIALYVTFYLYHKKEEFTPIYVLPTCICLVLAGKYCRMESYAILFLPLIFNEDFINTGKLYLKKNVQFYKVESFLFGLILVFATGIGASISTKLPEINFNEELVTLLKTSNYNRLWNSYDDGAKLCAIDIPYMTSAWAEVPGEYIARSVEFEYSSLVQDPMEYLDNLHIDAILMPIKDVTSEVIRLINNNSDIWECIYTDDNYKFYLRKNN